MASSQYKGRIDLDANRIAADEPISSSYAYQLINNANHLADQAGQVRVAVSGVELGTGTLTASTVDTWMPIVTFGPFPLTIGSSGAPYPLRCRLAGRCTQGSTTADLRLVVSTYADTLRRLSVFASSVADNVLEASTASTSAAWLAATGSKTLITIPDDVTREALTARSTIDGVGGDPVDVSVVMVIASVWGRSPDSGNEVICSGVYLAEYVGA